MTRIERNPDIAMDVVRRAISMPMLCRGDLDPSPRKHRSFVRFRIKVIVLCYYYCNYALLLLLYYEKITMPSFCMNICIIIIRLYK